VTWHAINTHTARHQDAFLLEVVRPWFEAVSRLHRVYFVRHWQGGPHVSVRVDADADRFRDELAPPLVDAATEWYRTREPESNAVSESTLRKLAERERHETVEELRPPGTVRLDVDLPRRVDAWGGPAGAELYESYHVDSTAHALDGVELAQTHGRLRLAFDTLVTAPDGLFGDVSVFFLSYRSHADGFLMGTPDPEATRAFFERSYTERREVLVQRVRNLLDGVDDPSAAWGRALNPRLHEYRDRAAEALRTGALAPAASEGIDPDDLDEELRHSSFHHTARRTGLHVAAEALPQWQSYRLAINYMYGDVVRLGLSGIERFLTCHLVAKAVGDALGLDPTAELERYAREKNLSFLERSPSPAEGARHA
jgi:hypothetical protein